MKKRYFLPLGLLLILAVLVFQHSIRPAAQTSIISNPAALLPFISKEDQVFIDQYEERLLKSIKTEGIPGAAMVIVMDSSIALLKGYGVRSLTDDRPVDVHTVFRLASISKGVTGLLAGLLEAEGKVQWDTPVLPYCKQLKLYSDEYAESLQLQHILSHSTGLPRHTYSNLLNLGVPYKEILPRLKGVKPAHPPGTYHNYQNVAFSLSGDILSGLGIGAFPELLQQKIFAPLQMTDASIGMNAMNVASNAALPHRRYADSYQTVEVKPNYYEVNPAAGINASISDMAKLLQALMGNRSAIVPDSVLREIFQPYVPIHLVERSVRKWDFLQSAHYGMGWRIFNTKTDMKIIQHSGFVNGYRTEIAFSPDEKVGIALLTNAPNATVGYFIPKFFESYIDSRECY